MGVEKIEIKIDNKTVLILLTLIALTISSIIGINQYKYGINDHSIIIPFIKSYLNPQLFKNDYLLKQKKYYYTYFWILIAKIIKLFKIKMVYIFFLLYLIAIFLYFLVSYRFALNLTGKSEVALISLFLLLFGRHTLAGITTIENLLLTRVFVLPFLIFSLNYFLQGKIIKSYALLGIGFLIHPMTTFYVLIMIFISSILKIKDVKLYNLLIGLLIFIIIITPLIIWQFKYHPKFMNSLLADGNWIRLLRLRSSHHLFPFSWGVKLYIQSLLICILFFLSFIGKRKNYKDSILLLWFIEIIGLCLIGTIFTEFVPLSLIITMQLFRSFQFVVFFSLIYYSNFLLTTFENSRDIYKKLGVIILSFFALYGVRGWQFAFIVFLILSLILLILQRRSSYTYQKSLPILTIIFSLILGIGGYLKRGGFSIYNAQKKSWLAVQYWAKNNSNINDLFIVPPSIEGFRVESERAIYADWKDGTLLNFNPKFGEIWYKRMLKLGFSTFKDFEKNYKRLNEPDFINIINEIKSYFKDIFIVRFSDSKPLNFKVVYKNKDFIVYKVNI